MEIKEEFKIVEEENIKERLGCSNLEGFKKTLVELERKVGKENILPYLLWGVWNEFILLEKTILTATKKSYIPLTEKINKEIK